MSQRTLPWCVDCIKTGYRDQLTGMPRRGKLYNNRQPVCRLHDNMRRRNDGKPNREPRKLRGQHVCIEHGHVFGSREQKLMHFMIAHLQIPNAARTLITEGQRPLPESEKMTTNPTTETAAPDLRVFVNKGHSCIEYGELIELTKTISSKKTKTDNGNGKEITVVQRKAMVRHGNDRHLHIVWQAHLRKRSNPTGQRAVIRRLKARRG